MRLVEVTHKLKCSSGLHVKTVVVEVVVVCEVSQASILALSLCLVPSKGTGWLFGRWIQSLIQATHPD